MNETMQEINNKINTNFNQTFQSNNSMQMNMPTNQSSVLIGSPDKGTEQVQESSFENSMQMPINSPRGMSIPNTQTMGQNNNGYMDPFMFMMSNMMNFYMSNPNMRQNFESQMGPMMQGGDNQNNCFNPNMMMQNQNMMMQNNNPAMMNMNQNNNPEPQNFNNQRHNFEFQNQSMQMPRMNYNQTLNTKSEAVSMAQSQAEDLKLKRNSLPGNNHHPVRSMGENDFQFNRKISHNDSLSLNAESLSNFNPNAGVNQNYDHNFNFAVGNQNFVKNIDIPQNSE